MCAIICATHVKHGVERPRGTLGTLTSGASKWHELPRRGREEQAVWMGNVDEAEVRSSLVAHRWLTLMIVHHCSRTSG